MSIPVSLTNYLADLLFAFLYFQYGKDTKRPFYLKLFPFLILALTGILYPHFMHRYFGNYYFRFFIRTLIYFLYLLFSHRIRPMTALYAAAYCSIIITLAQNILFAPLFTPLMEPVLSGSWTKYLLAIIICLSIKGILYYLISRYTPLEGMHPIDVTRFMVLISVTLISLYLKDTEMGIRTAPDENYTLSAFYIVLQLVLIFLLASVEQYRRLLQQQSFLRMQSLSVKALTDTIEQDRIHNEKVRSIRHDMKNHMLTLQLLLKNGENEKAERYIENFIGQLTPPSNRFYTGNILLDGILTVKAGQAEKQGLRFEAAMDFRNGSFISDSDLCTMFGNILDNAMEAASQCKKEGFIAIHGGPSANMLLVRVENSSPSRPRFLGDLPVTSKIDRINHGFGLRNVRDLAQKYGGNLSFSYNEEKESFITTLLLPCPDHEEKRA